VLTRGDGTGESFFLKRVNKDSPSTAKKTRLFPNRRYERVISVLIVAKLKTTIPRILRTIPKIVLEQIFSFKKIQDKRVITAGIVLRITPLSPALVKRSPYTRKYPSKPEKTK